MISFQIELKMLTEVMNQSAQKFTGNLGIVINHLTRIRFKVGAIDYADAANKDFLCTTNATIKIWNNKLF